jgi:hypothetical protein
VPWDQVKDKDERYGVETSCKKDVRKEIEGVKIHMLDIKACSGHFMKERVKLVWRELQCETINWAKNSFI